MLPGVRATLTARKPEIAALEVDTLGAKLKRRRLELGLQQKDSLNALGVCEQTLVHWERGDTEPPVAHYPAIIAFLGYEPWPPASNFPEQLVAERRRRGMSIKEAAREIGVDPATMGMWELRQRLPFKRIANNVLRFLKADADTSNEENGTGT